MFLCGFAAMSQPHELDAMKVRRWIGVIMNDPIMHTINSLLEIMFYGSIIVGLAALASLGVAWGLDMLTARRKGK